MTKIWYMDTLNGVEYERSIHHEDLCQMNSMSGLYYCSLPRGHGGQHLAFYNHNWNHGVCFRGPWLDDKVMLSKLRQQVEEGLDGE